MCISELSSLNHSMPCKPGPSLQRPRREALKMQLPSMGQNPLHLPTTRLGSQHLQLQVRYCPPRDRYCSCSVLETVSLISKLTQDVCKMQKNYFVGFLLLQDVSHLYSYSPEIRPRRPEASLIVHPRWWSLIWTVASGSADAAPVMRMYVSSDKANDIMCLPILRATSI